jgi:hypothetical protein
VIHKGLTPLHNVTEWGEFIFETNNVIGIIP